VEVVSVSIEKGLLKRADRMARKRKISRARLIAEGLERVLAKAERTRATGRTAKKTRRRAA
jgi:metal-responsive CopG/Arc/MetJ family transcriptional regulator